MIAVEQLTKGGMLATASALIGMGMLFYEKGMYQEGTMCVIVGCIMFLAREFTKAIFYEKPKE